MSNNDDIKLFMRDYSYRTVGPVIYRYVRWIISEAQKRGLKRLYFLARDGYLLREIAVEICSRLGLDIECKYLYCSRASLRMPSYHLIGDEAYELLLLGGYFITPDSVLDRCELSEGEKTTICKELGIEDRSAPLDENAFNSFKEGLRKSEYYRELINEKSRRAYAPAIDYLIQSGLLLDDCVAIVDSGWTGSMQRSIRQLLESAGFSGSLIGFYFGMYAEPKSKDDGEYLTYYFNSDSGAKRKTMFNNNLFECMLSANHPMTVGYEYRDGMAAPIFAKPCSEEMAELIECQHEGALKYVRELDEKLMREFDKDLSIKECYSILKRAMIYPTGEEALMYGKFTFCDDVTEGYQISLADKSMRAQLGKYMFVSRVFRKLTGRKRTSGADLFWVHGVIACLPAIQRPWYRINIILWDWLKAILKK